jgi:hypothetical protein
MSHEVTANNILCHVTIQELLHMKITAEILETCYIKVPFLRNSARARLGKCMEEDVKLSTTMISSAIRSRRASWTKVYVLQDR